MPRIFYRIIRSGAPDLLDFTSAESLGEPSPPDPDLARLWDGISAFATETQARNKAKCAGGRRRSGNLVAEIPAMFRVDVNIFVKSRLR